MLTSETIPLADACLLKYIIHDWDDDQAIQILESIRKANQGQNRKIVTLFLMEMVIVPIGQDNWEAHSIDLIMLTTLSARERSLDQFKHLLKRSGYEIKQLHKTGGSLSIMEAERIF